MLDINSFLVTATCQARHPGAGRDPVTTTLIQALRLLDSGLRRNDERECGADACHTTAVLWIIPDSSGPAPEGSTAATPPEM
jgi:hypothetical protein